MSGHKYEVKKVTHSGVIDWRKFCGSAKEAADLIERDSDGNAMLVYTGFSADYKRGTAYYVTRIY